MVIFGPERDHQISGRCIFVVVLRNLGPCHGQSVQVSVTKLIQINFEATVCRTQIIVRRAVREYGETAGSTSPFCCATAL